MNATADVACVEKLKLLAEPTRLKILELLLRRSLHVNQINEKIGIEPNLLSHHLKVLREGGLIVATRDGKALLYRLADGVAPEDNTAALDLGCCRLSF